MAPTRDTFRTSIGLKAVMGVTGAILAFSSSATCSATCRSSRRSALNHWRTSATLPERVAARTP
jgi:hypothetical protein